MKLGYVVPILSLGVAFVARPVVAQPVCELPVSAYLSDAAGEALTGSVDVELRFYAEPEPDAAPVECRSFEALAIDRGWMRVNVDGCAAPEPTDCGIAPLSELFGTAPGVWVGVSVGGEELGPRIPVGAVPFAFRAGDSDALQGRAAEEFATAEDLGDHAADRDAHHSSTSHGIAITPSSVTIGDTHLEAGRVDLGPDTTDELTEEIVRTLTGGGDADALHGHVSSGHGAPGCYSAWGVSTCIDGYTVASSGVASMFVWSGGAGGQPFCVDSSAIETINSGWPGSGYFGFLTLSNDIRSVDLNSADLACVLCCP